MALPAANPTDPRDFASSAMRAEFFQDLVAATARFIHGQKLTRGDRKRLAECRDALLAASVSDLALPDPGTQTLADDRESLMELLAVAEHQPIPFKDLAAVVDRVLRGRRTTDALMQAGQLRDLFVICGRVSLRSTVHNEQDRELDQPWMPWTESSASSSEA